MVWRLTFSGVRRMITCRRLNILCRINTKGKWQIQRRKWIPWCAICSVMCSVLVVQCVVLWDVWFSGTALNLALYSITTQGWIEDYKLHTAHFTLHTAHWTIHTTHCALYSAHCTMLTSYYKMPTAHFVGPYSVCAFTHFCKEIYDAQKYYGILSTPCPTYLDIFYNFL